MLKENYFNHIFLFFIGILVIYLFNQPPTIIVKHQKIDNMKNVNYLVENNILSHAEFCENK
jgi:hypothetical protein